MKRLAIVILAACLLLTAACSGEGKPDPGSGNDQALEGSLESIMEKIYDRADLSDTFREFAETGLMIQEITEENCEYHLGKGGLEYEEAIVSEPMMSGSAYSLCLVRAKDGADIEQLKQDIKESVNPFKWVCVGVDKDNIIVDNIGNLVILIMSDTEAEALHTAFLGLGD